MVYHVAGAAFRVSGLLFELAHYCGTALDFTFCCPGYLVSGGVAEEGD
jgi:hypothetical protein